MSGIQPPVSRRRTSGISAFSPAPEWCHPGKKRLLSRKYFRIAASDEKNQRPTMCAIAIALAAFTAVVYFGARFIVMAPH
jgi:hypothetical protein